MPLKFRYRKWAVFGDNLFHIQPDPSTWKNGVSHHWKFGDFHGLKSAERSMGDRWDVSLGFSRRLDLIYRGSRIDSIPSGGIICHQYFFFLVYTLIYFMMESGIKVFWLGWSLYMIFWACEFVLGVTNISWGNIPNQFGCQMMKYSQSTPSLKLPVSPNPTKMTESRFPTNHHCSRAIYLAILCDLFGMVKWPFKWVQRWPRNRGSKGHGLNHLVC